MPVTFALTKQQELQVSYAQSFAQDVRLALIPPGEAPTDTPGQDVPLPGAPQQAALAPAAAASAVRQ